MSHISEPANLLSKNTLKLTMHNQTILTLERTLDLSFHRPLTKNALAKNIKENLTKLPLWRKCPAFPYVRILGSRISSAEKFNPAAGSLATAITAISDQQAVSEEFVRFFSNLSTSTINKNVSSNRISTAHQRSYHPAAIDLLP